MRKSLKAALMTGLCLFSLTQAREITVKGSDTMLNLVQRLAESFGSTQADATVSVTGGGSGVGINALVNRDTDIANASRGIKSKEVSDARANGVEPLEIPIAIDGLSIIVNASNPVQQLTKDQVGAIYRGSIKNWKDVGGPNKKITLYGRQPSSGTFDFMREQVMHGDYDPGMLQMNGNAQIVEAIKADRSAIGYCGIGYARSADGISVVRVASTEGGDYVSPLDSTNIYNGSYPITRPLFQYTNGKPSGDLMSFISFELGDAGQQVVQGEGFYHLTADYQAVNEAHLR